MKPWIGRILTGVRGADLLSALSAEANEQAIQRSATGSSIRYYEPWMSNAKHRHHWQHLSRESGAPPDPIYLNNLRKAVSISGPLSEISPANDSQDIETNPLINETFQSYFSAIQTKFSNIASDYASRIDSLVAETIPLRPLPGRTFREDGEGLSTHVYRGSVFLGPAYRVERCLCEDQLNFIHEVAHQALNLISNADDLIKGDCTAPVYSVIRRSLRPGIMSMHAVAAVGYMVEAMTRGQSIFVGSAPPSWIKARLIGLIHDLDVGLAGLRLLRLTDCGSEIIQELSEISSWAKSRSER